MKFFAQLLVGLIGIEHFIIMYVEMFLWTKPFALKAFNQTLVQAESSKVLAANQGLYNGFLGAGLIVSLIADYWPGQVYFALCVLVAGLYGGLTAKRSILFVQALPAALCLTLLWFSK